MDSVQAIQQQCFDDTKDWFPNVSENTPYLVIALAGEVGEFANMVKKDMRDGVEYTKDHHLDLCMELVDIFIYLCLLANQFNLHLGEGYEVKRSLNVERFASTDG